MIYKTPLVIADISKDYRKLVTWECPGCGRENIDFQDDYTHCSFCGEVVWVLYNDYDIEDQKWKIDINAE